ncbi:hypothetical protein FGO68_gene13141 [Halteria grandinella]|uniref:Transmembrane protein n=1 Tax=Halteria grandinella TaxID=5974 RepID=A0A8J8NBG3_HALGN|nr:hypothetical protein FGO68_gene13141 [Halteria grandinella]
MMVPHLMSIFSKSSQEISGFTVMIYQFIILFLCFFSLGFNKSIKIMKLTSCYQIKFYYQKSVSQEFQIKFL